MPAVCRHWALAAVLLAPINSACAPLQGETHREPPLSTEKSLTGDSEPSKAIESIPELDTETGNTPKVDTEISTGYSFWPWKEGGAAKPPPVKPYRLPTLSGDNLDYHDKPAPLVKAPAIDAEAVYDYVLACYPEKSKWNLDVNLRAQLASTPDSILSSDGTNTTELGSSYVAIVANMPLYSITELNREREREHARRQEVAGVVADFIAAMASRNHAIRELALYRSLEARSSLRVQQGIAESTEQVKFLEKVAASHETLIKQEARIMDTRLKLSGMCDPANAATLNTWLKQVSAVPRKESAP